MLWFTLSLGGGKNSSDVKNFLGVIHKIRELSHPHILGWIGISRIQGKYVTISQYMSNGGLRDYLLKQTEQASLCQCPLYDPCNWPSYFYWFRTGPLFLCCKFC